MKITVLSDLHLEFAPLEPVLTDSDVLILAGDIFVIESLANEKYRSRLDKFLYGISGHYDQIFSIAGNHEYYGSNINGADDTIRDIYSHYNIKFIQNEQYEYNGVNFIGTTLWTNVDPIRSFRIQESMSDYMVIRNDNHKLNTNDTDQLNHSMRLYLEDQLNQTDMPCVVITHHAPSFNSISNYYRRPENSLLNSAFANRMDDIMDKHDNIRLWAHGHVHSSFDYMINQTRVVCNPRGYPGEHQYTEWDQKHQVVLNDI